MSKPEDYYFAIQYNNTHALSGDDRVFIVRRELFDDKKEGIFEIQVDDVDALPAFLEKFKLCPTETAYLYDTAGSCSTQLLYEELIETGMEENDEIPEHLNLYLDIVEEEEAIAKGSCFHEDDYDRFGESSLDGNEDE